MKMNRNFRAFIDFKSLELEVPTICLVTGGVSGRRERRYSVAHCRRVEFCGRHGIAAHLYLGILADKVLEKRGKYKSTHCKRKGKRYKTV
jgi:hypothetical protein